MDEQYRNAARQQPGIAAALRTPFAQAVEREFAGMEQSVLGTMTLHEYFKETKAVTLHLKQIDNGYLVSGVGWHQKYVPDLEALELELRKVLYGNDVPLAPVDAAEAGLLEEPVFSFISISDQTVGSIVSTVVAGLINRGMEHFEATRAVDEVFMAAGYSDYHGYTTRSVGSPEENAQFVHSLACVLDRPIPLKMGEGKPEGDSDNA